MPARDVALARPSQGAIWSALGSVYVIWGSTYLAIRVTIETIPPLLSAGVRFLIAGGLLYAWAIRRGDRQGDRPRGRQWRSAAIIGVALLLGGNGAVSLAEQTVPSGITAILIAAIPLWMVLIRRGVLGERVTWREVTGLVVGFAGLIVLIRPFGSGSVDPVGTGLLVFASLSWAAGSLYARKAPLPSRPLVGTGMEMLAGGAALVLASAISGELADLDLAAISGRSLLGLGFLIVFGSLVAFSAYVWLLRVARTSLVATYAYVNPVVAVFLGWAVLGEAVTVTTVAAGAIIVVGVALIVSAGGEHEAETSEAQMPPVEDQRLSA